MEAKKKEKYLSHLLGLTIVISFVIPHTGMALMLVSPLLCVILALISKQKINHTYSMFVIISLVLSLLYNLPQNISFKSVTSTFSLILLFFFFPFIRKIHLSNRYLYFTLFYILITQFAYTLDIPWIIRFMDTTYPIGDDSLSSGQLDLQNNVDWGNMYDYRLGGFYRNANRCAMSLTILLATFISNNFLNTVKKNLPFILANSYAIFITGSRSGFIIGCLVIFAYIFANKTIHNFWRFIAVTISIVGFLNIVSKGSDTYRSLNVSAGMDNSANEKYIVFEDYITNEKSGDRFIIGYTDASRFKPSKPIMPYFDSDYGNMIYCYGFLFFIALLLFYYKIFRDMDYSGRIYLIPLLWIFTAAMLTSFRHSIIYMLLLSYIYMTHRKQKPLNSDILTPKKTTD